MWLPLSKPGGSFVATRNAFNEMQNNRLLKEMNEVKRNYLPTTLGAEAASKLAYANLMGPQFMAKLLQDPKFLGNLKGNEATNFKNTIVRAANMPQGMNALNQTPENTGNGGGGLGNAFNESPAGQLWSGLKNLLGKHGTELSSNPMQQQNMPQQMPQQLNNNAQAIPSQQVVPAPEAQAQTSEDYESKKEALYKKFIETPEGQAEIDKYNRGEPSRLDLGMDALKESLVNEANGVPLELELNGGKNPPADEGDYIANAAKAQGALAQGTKSGEYRADALKDIGEKQLGLSNAGAAQDELIKIIKNPIWQHARDTFPGFQKQQLSVLKVTGSPEFRKLAGEYTAAGQAMVASQVAGMGSRHLVREYSLAEKQKINDSDTIESSEGKLTNAKNLHDIAEKKNIIIKNLLKKGVDEADAVEEANKRVDVSAIRRATDKLLERQISVTNKKTGVTKMMTVKEAQKEGVPDV